jgi:hypothetical protein
MGEKGDGGLAEAAIFVEMATGTAGHKPSKYSMPTAISVHRPTSHRIVRFRYGEKTTTPSQSRVS